MVCKSWLANTKQVQILKKRPLICCSVYAAKYKKILYIFGFPRSWTFQHFGILYFTVYSVWSLLWRIRLGNWSFSQVSPHVLNLGVLSIACLCTATWLKGFSDFRTVNSICFHDQLSVMHHMQPDQRLPEFFRPLFFVRNPHEMFVMLRYLFLVLERNRSRFPQIWQYVAACCITP